MDKIIVINNGDGTVRILNPAPEMFDENSRTRKELAEKGITFENDEEVIDWIIKKDVPKGLSYRITEKNKLPSNRQFRNAWTDDRPTKTVDVDMPRANEIHRNKLRELRKPLLDSLDVEYMRADEAGDFDQKKKISSKKQALRDVTKFKDFTDVKDAVIPDILKSE